MGFSSLIWVLEYFKIWLIWTLRSSLFFVLLSAAEIAAENIAESRQRACRYPHLKEVENFIARVFDHCGGGNRFAGGQAEKICFPE